MHAPATKRDIRLLQYFIAIEEHFVQSESQERKVQNLAPQKQDAWRRRQIFSNNGVQNGWAQSEASLGLLDGAQYGQGQLLTLDHSKVVQWKTWEWRDQTWSKAFCSSFSAAASAISEVWWAAQTPAQTQHEKIRHILKQS